MQDFAKWEIFANSLGITTAKSNSKELVWYDFEEFLIDGITISDESSRLFTSLFFVFNESIDIISTNKLIKLANKKFKRSKQWKILGFFIDRSLGDTFKKTQWKNSLSKIKKMTIEEEELLFKSKAFRKNKDLLIWGLESNNLEFDKKDKYLKEKVFYNHPIIKMRFNGTQALFSDILFFKEFNNKDISYREISRYIHADHSQVYNFTKMIEKIGPDNQA